MPSKEIAVPVSLEAELIVLSGAIHSFDWRSEMLASLSGAHFYDLQNRIIFDSIDYLSKNDLEVTFDAIIEILDRKGAKIERLYEINGMPYLSRVPADLIVDILDSSKKRELQTACDGLVNSIGHGKNPFKDVFNEFDRKISDIANGNNHSGARSIVEIISNPDLFEEYRKKSLAYAQGRQELDGIPTGFYDLDRYIGGLCPGHLTIIGARPGVGKTSFILNLIENLILKANIGIHFFSLEMPAREIVSKLLFQLCEVEFQRARVGNISSEQLDLIQRIGTTLMNRNINIDDQPSLDIGQIKSRAKFLKRSKATQVIFIDYLQMIISPAKAKESRQLEIAYVSRTLKELAKELNLPIIAAAQLNRDLEKRSDKSPQLSDLRESGGIEADADEILLLHRPSIYKDSDRPGILEVHLEKNRFGPTGKIDLLFDGKTGKIKNYAKF